MDIRGGDLLKVILLRVFQWLPWKTDVQNLGLMCRYASKIRREFYLNTRVSWVVKDENAKLLQQHWSSFGLRPIDVVYPKEHPFGEFSQNFRENFRFVELRTHVASNFDAYLEQWPNITWLQCKLNTTEKLDVPSGIRRLTCDIADRRVIHVHDRVRELCTTGMAIWEISPFSKLTKVSIYVDDAHIPVLPETVTYYELTLDHNSVGELHLKLPKKLLEFYLTTLCQYWYNRSIYLPQECENLEVLKIHGVAKDNKNELRSTFSHIFIPTYRKLQELILRSRIVTFLGGLSSLTYVSDTLLLQGSRVDTPRITFLGQEEVMRFQDIVDALNPSLKTLGLVYELQPIGFTTNDTFILPQIFPIELSFSKVTGRCCVRRR